MSYRYWKQKLPGEFRVGAAFRSFAPVQQFGDETRVKSGKQSLRKLT
jgi:hypothetical protein